MRFCLILCLSVTLIACSDTAKLTALAPDSSILAFGNSLTSGFGGDGTSYPSVLQQLSGIEVINAGVPGEISAQGLNRLPTLLDRYQPQLLILCHGGNDIIRRLDLKTMQQNLEEMVMLAKQRNIEVILIGVPDFSFFLDTTDQHDAVAKKHSLPYLADTLPDILGKGSLKSDQIHPNAEGYKLMANEIFELMIKRGAIAR